MKCATVLSRRLHVGQHVSERGEREHAWWHLRVRKEEFLVAQGGKGYRLRQGLLDRPWLR